jgi:RNA polymerase sigma factor (sigma-70 family)
LLRTIAQARISNLATTPWPRLPIASNPEKPSIVMRVTRAELIPTRATLIERLKNWQDQTSWQEFFDIYWQLIYCVARKGGLTEVEAQDAVQETLMSVAKHIPTFKYDPALGSFKAWLLNMTRWRITDQLRKRGPLSRHRKAAGLTSTSDTATVEALPDPAGAEIDKYWEVEWQNSLLAGAIGNVKRRLDPQKYQVFDCYVNKGWAAPKVASAFGLSLDQVYVAKHRVTQLIRDEVQRLEKEMT